MQNTRLQDYKCTKLILYIVHWLLSCWACQQRRWFGSVRWPAFQFCLTLVSFFQSLCSGRKQGFKIKDSKYFIIFTTPAPITLLTAALMINTALSNRFQYIGQQILLNMHQSGTGYIFTPKLIMQSHEWPRPECWSRWLSWRFSSKP